MHRQLLKPILNMKMFRLRRARRGLTGGGVGTVLTNQPRLFFSPTTERAARKLDVSFPEHLVSLDLYNREVSYKYNFLLKLAFVLLRRAYVVFNLKL
jgi:hypothetical protein